jgi:multiple sugar transport system permease protein
MTRTIETIGRHRPRRATGKTTLTIAVWICVAYFILPLVWLLISSTKTQGDLFSTFGYAFGQRFALWDNIVAVFQQGNGIYGRWMLNTLLYSGVSAIGAALLAAAAGYGFSKFQFRGRSVMLATVLGALMVPTAALAIPTYFLFSDLKLTNTMLAVIIPSLVSPFYANEAVPDSLIEAARIDGASEWRIFAQIAMRLLLPATATVLLFALVHTWNNYLLPLIMLNTSELFPVTVGLASWQSEALGASGGSQALFNVVITGATISLLPIVIAFLFLQRYWQSGLAEGGVKA